MKLLVEPDLAALNAFLSNVNVGDYVVSGQMESYSCACVELGDGGTDASDGKAADAETRGRKGGEEIEDADDD
ncbi:MAG: hypothetical protein ACO3IJ_00430 [Steroidobacteraceae bacterium]